MLAGEARLRAVLVDRRGPHRERPAERTHELLDVAERELVAARDRLDDGAGERDAGRERETGARGLPEPYGLGSELRVVARLRERDDLGSPEHRHLACATVDPHARAVGDQRGPFARADDARDPVLARDDRRV